MTSFLIEEFDHYKVSHHSGSKDDSSLATISFKIPSGTVRIEFVHNVVSKNEVLERNDRKHFTIYYQYNRYADLIDILRNEEPLFFYYNFESNQAYLTTSDEPVGEGE